MIQFPLDDRLRFLSRGRWEQDRLSVIRQWEFFSRIAEDALRVPRVEDRRIFRMTGLTDIGDGRLQFRDIRVLEYISVTHKQHE